MDRTKHFEALLPDADWIDEPTDDLPGWRVSFSAISTFRPLFDDTNVEDNYDFTAWARKEGLVPDDVDDDPEYSCSYFYCDTKEPMVQFLENLRARLIKLDEERAGSKKLL